MTSTPITNLQSLLLREANQGGGETEAEWPGLRTQESSGPYGSQPLSRVSQAMSSTVLLPASGGCVETQARPSSPSCSLIPGFTWPKHCPTQALGANSQGHTHPQQPCARPACPEGPKGATPFSTPLLLRVGLRAQAGLWKFGLIVKHAMRCHMTPFRMARIKQRMVSAGQEVKSGPSHTAGGGGKWCSHFGKAW